MYCDECDLLSKRNKIIYYSLVYLNKYNIINVYFDIIHSIIGRTKKYQCNVDYLNNEYHFFFQYRKQPLK